MLDAMFGISILAMALMAILGILTGLDKVPGRNWVSWLGNTAIVAEFVICGVYDFRFIPTTSIAAANAVAIRLAIMLVLGIVLAVAGDNLQDRREKRKAAEIKRAIANIKKDQRFKK